MFEVFLKILLIIMRFGENVLGPKFVHIYQFWGFAGLLEEVTWSTLYFFFIIHKKLKSTRA